MTRFLSSPPLWYEAVMGWVGLLCAAAAIAAPALSERVYNYASLQTPLGFWPSYYLVHPQPLEEELNFEKLIDLIDREQVTSIEELIPRLPWQMRDANYIVMHRSRSLQAGTRVISFTPTARLILTFNDGDPAHRGHDTVEAIQFRAETARFEFRELSFNGRSRPQVSAPDPAKCVACHQSPTRVGVDLRPNWEPYNAWPGAIGAADGQLGKSFAFAREDAPNPLRPEDFALVLEQQRERAIAEGFVATAATHPRFRHLETLRPHATVDFSDRLAPLNFLRLMRLLREEGPVYEATRELTYAIGHCESSALEAALAPFAARAPWRYVTEPKESGYSLSRHLTWLFEGLGVDTSDWSMDFGTRGRFGIFERFGAPSNPAVLFGWAYKQSEPAAAALSAQGCERVVPYAAAKAQAYLAEGAPGSRDVRALTPPVSAGAVLGRCVRCHAEGASVAPPIPFHDPAALRVALTRESSHGRSLLDEISRRTGGLAPFEEQMPPDARLTPEEAEALRAYLAQVQSN